MLDRLAPAVGVFGGAIIPTCKMGGSCSKNEGASVMPGTLKMLWMLLLVLVVVVVVVVVAVVLLLLLLMLLLLDPLSFLLWHKCRAAPCRAPVQPVVAQEQSIA